MNPMLRQFITIKQMSLEADEDVEGFWLSVEAGQTETMSAVGYFFSKSIHKRSEAPRWRDQGRLGRAEHRVVHQSLGA